MNVHTESQANQVGKALRIVKNSGEGTRGHLAEIRELLETCERAELCTGWMKRAGLMELEPTLRHALGRGAVVKMYSGQEDTEPEAATKAATLQGLMHFVVPASEKYLHAKLYYFERGNSYTALLGSANVTAGALLKNIELSVCLAGNVGDEMHRELRTFLDDVSKLARPAAEVRPLGVKLGRRRGKAKVA